MTTNASIGFGTLFKIFDTSVSPEAYVTVGEVTSITLPNLTRDAVDATHTESTGGWREFIPGLKDAGEVKIEMNFDYSSASDELIRAQFASSSLTQCQIEFSPAGSPTESLTFSGIITGYEVSVPLDDKMAATVTVKVSGQVTYTG